jgi:alanine racemase
MLGGVSEFAVARTQEAVQFRDEWTAEVDVAACDDRATQTNKRAFADLGDKRPPLLLLGLALAHDVEALIDRNVQFTIWCKAQLASVINTARRMSRRAVVQIKCNTGMNRIGVDAVDDLQELIAMARGNADAVELRAVYTHFACAGRAVLCWSGK